MEDASRLEVRCAVAVAAVLATREDVGESSPGSIDTPGAFHQAPVQASGAEANAGCKAVFVRGFSSMDRVVLAAPAAESV